MHFPLKSLALSGLTLLFLSLPAFSQMTAIEGDVKGADGKPVAGATIQFDRTDIKGTYSVKTDKKGHYGHYGLPLGTYNVSVLVDKKVVDGMKGVKTKFSDATEVPFNIKPAGEGGDADSGIADAERGMSKEQKAEFEKKNKDREAQLAKNKELNDSYNAGKAALEAKNWDEAVAQFTKASTLDDKQVVVWAGLADALVGQAGTKPPADAAPLYDKGFDAYRKAIELKPDDAAYYNNFAIALAKDKKLDEARTNLDKAAQLDPPGAGKYFYNMGALLVNSAQNDAACEEFKKAITSDPNYADAQYQFGVCNAAKAVVDPKTGKISPPEGTIDALQKYIDLKGATCASATETSAPAGCENVSAAKAMIAQLGGSVSTNYSNPSAAPKKKK